MCVSACWPMKHPEASGFRPINVCPRIRTVGGWAATDAQRQRPLEEGKFLGVCVHMVEYLGDAREFFFVSLVARRQSSTPRPGDHPKRTDDSDLSSIPLQK